MMQATNFGNLHDSARRGELDGPDIRRILVEREMRASPVIVREVRGQDASQMPLAENDSMVEALASHRADEPLREGILPRAVGHREDFVDPHALHNTRPRVRRALGGREVVRGVPRVAVLQHPGVYSERTMQDMLKRIRAAAVGIELQVLDAKGPHDFDTAFSAMAKARAGALIIFSSPMFYVNYRRLVDLAAQHRLPAMYVFREAVEAGGLMCYGANIPDLVRRAAAYVEKILKGAKPADLPIQQPTKFELVINLKTAKALGLTIPNSILLRADEVIE